MSRCVCCNEIMLHNYKFINKNTKQEEDMCLHCRRASQDVRRVHDYAFEGVREGLKVPPVEYYEDNK